MGGDTLAHMNDQQPDNPTDQPTDDTTELPPEPETAPTEEQSTGPGRGSKRLLRSRSDRMVFGVAGGLARYFDVDPVIFRIAFGVSVFFGGLGILAYIALALFVPSDGEGSRAPVQRSRGWLVAGIVLVALVLGSAVGGLFWGGGWGNHPWGALWVVIPIAVIAGAVLVLRDRGGEFSLGRLIAAILIAGAVIVGFFTLALIGLFATATGHGVVVGAVVLAIGALLVGAAFLSGTGRWLVVPALALATGVGVAAAADLHFEGGIGERSYTPLSAAAIPADGYHLGIGELKIDLRQIDWQKHDVVDLNADLGVGELRIAVPEKVCVEADTHATAGSLVVTGSETHGTDVDNNTGAYSTATPRLRLTGDIKFGEIRVINDDQAALGQHLGRFGGQDSAALRATETKACAA